MKRGIPVVFQKRAFQKAVPKGAVQNSAVQKRAVQNSAVQNRAVQTNAWQKSAWQKSAWHQRTWQKLHHIVTVGALALVATFGGAALNADQGATHHDASHPAPTLLVMGDSLSAAYGMEQAQGWVALLAERLDGQAAVVNASISGETTSGGAQRFADILRQQQPNIVLLELGGNDGLRGLPPAQMRANLAAMIEQSQQADADVLLLGIDIPPNYGQAYRDAFTGVFHSLADEYEIPLVPFLLEGVALNRELMQSDGIHPTADAQPIILDNVWPKLEPLLSEHTQKGAAQAKAE